MTTTIKLSNAHVQLKKKEKTYNVLTNIYNEIFLINMNYIY